MSHHLSLSSGHLSRLSSHKKHKRKRSRSRSRSDDRSRSKSRKTSKSKHSSASKHHLDDKIFFKEHKKSHQHKSTLPVHLSSHKHFKDHRKGKSNDYNEPHHLDKICRHHHKSKSNRKEKDLSSMSENESERSIDNSGDDSEDDQPSDSREKRSRDEERHESQSRERDSSHVQRNTQAQEVLDYNLDFTKYKHSLGKIFFRGNQLSLLAQRGNADYDEFWAFVERFQNFQRKKAEKTKANQGKSQASQSRSGSLDLPQTYDVQYKINFSFICKEFEEILKKGRLVDYRLEKELTRERIVQFRGILLHFLDFQQKQKFQKLYKIRRDQRNLPIFQFKNKIIEMVKEHQVIVVAGDTGCGKSTQVPQYLMEAGFEKIACTQPRRIACISLSKRVGYETLNEYGSQVAYQVRFEKSKTAATKILFLTEGLLLRQITTDPLLEMYSVIVIDEVHERHIFTDFLLGVLKCVLMQRTDLKLVLMSATININLFSGYFRHAPVIKVPGRLYPIQLEYCPMKSESSDSRRNDPTPYLKIMQKIDHKYPSNERGDLLIFLSGMSEIMAVVEAAKAYAQQTKRWIILPLHSSLSVDEQDKVFDISPDNVRKCIVSTNIAETSVTIDGVRFIVDSGKVKEMSFDPKYKMQKLEEFWISRASSEQRKGRAGRTGPGVCFRLYDESDYDAFQDYATPEILRVPLDSLILQMISMGLPNARKFPFIESPNMSSIENSIIFLKEQGALSSDESLTPIGQMLSMLPVDVVIGKMLIMGSIFNMIDPVLSITAAMSVQSPFTNKAYTDPEATTARKPLESDHGDPFTLLNAFDEWIQVKAQGQGTKKWSKRRGLEEQRFYEMTKLKRQFKSLLEDHHLLDEVEERQLYLTSEERMVKHGERKRLGQLRKEKMRERKRRKVLKLEDEEYQVSDNDDNDAKEGEDIKDLEFRLSNDLNQLQKTSNKSRSFTLRDINLMKIILCSGLYPQVSIADDCNSYKRDSEQAFHTKNKPFILLHPTGIFAGQPDLLMPKDAGGKRPAPSDLKGLMSSRHELLSYVSLLETNSKPYLVNSMRIPALQTVTLFSNCIDTNESCTRLLCDEWLEIKFKCPETAQKLISDVIQLRSTWESLLKVRLQDTFEGIEEERRVSPRARKLQRLLASKLTEFLDSNVLYSIRRVLPAETHRAFIGPGKDRGNAEITGKLLKSGDLCEEHSVKGGLRITDYLTFNCLLDDGSASVWGDYTSTMQRHWVCPYCSKSLVVTVLERLQHEAVCSMDEEKGLNKFEMEADEKEKNSSLNPLRKTYFCPDCEENLSLTATEILKHRKTHSK